jgi:hypothetical protein
MSPSNVVAKVTHWTLALFGAAALVIVGVGMLLWMGESCSGG